MSSRRIYANYFWVSFLDFELVIWNVITLAILLNIAVDVARDNHSIGIANKAERAYDNTKLFRV